MDWKTASEEAWKNGYEKGYTLGTVEGATKSVYRSALKWRKRPPKEDIPHCLVVVGKDRTKQVFIASYDATKRTFLAEDPELWDCKLRIMAKDAILWAEFKLPIEISVPEEEDGNAPERV